MASDKGRGITVRLTPEQQDEIDTFYSNYELGIEGDFWHCSFCGNAWPKMQGGYLMAQVGSHTAGPQLSGKIAVVKLGPCCGGPIAKVIKEVQGKS